MVKYNTIKLKPVISVLPNDYETLTNKPSIDGIILNGKISSQSLNLLSSNKDLYESIDISLIEKNKMSEYNVVILGADKPMKIGLDKILEDKKVFTTVTELDMNSDIGSYQFVEKNK